PTKQVPGLPKIDGKTSAEIDSDFLIEFTEPMVPQSVGLSAVLNGGAFDGNLPAFTWPNPPVPPLPNVNLTSPTTAATPIFIPFDLNPVATNNLARYILHPLITLPPNATIQIVVQDVNVNTKASFDLHGNALASGKNFIKNLATGDGPALVNAPVSPEVIYWLPSGARGMGAIDLNGFGFTTNKPDAHGDVNKNQFSQDQDQLIFTSIITRR